jgi:hypothetical protein
VRVGSRWRDPHDLNRPKHNKLREQTGTSVFRQFGRPILIFARPGNDELDEVLRCFQPERRARGARPRRALALQGGGPYVVQAAIASLHMDEPHDWPQIAALYGELARLTGSPIVELNRAIGVAETEGAEAGLALVDRLGLDSYQYFHSTRADLLRRLGRAAEARTEYERALELARTEHERRFLRRRIAEVSA